MSILYNVLFFPLKRVYLKEATIAAVASFLWSWKMKNMWILNQRWTKIFIFSHFFGYTIAFLQTLWIIREVKKGRGS
jgi:hypothetical protein